MNNTTMLLKVLYKPLFLFALSLLYFQISSLMAVAQAKSKTASSIAKSERQTFLQDTLEKAYMQNAELDAARANLRVVDENVAQAVSDWRPSLSVRGEQRQTLTYPIGSALNRFGVKAKPGNQHNFSTGYTATASQNIFRGGATVAGVEGAKSNVKAGRFSLLKTEQNVLLDAIRFHLDILSAEAIVGFRRKSEDFYKKTLNRTKARFEVGEISRTDVVAAEAAYEGARADVSEAIGRLETSRASYIRQVGDLPRNLAQAKLLLPLVKKLSEAFEQADMKNPVILEGKYNLKTAEYEVNRKIAGLLPTIDVQGKVGNSRSGGTGIGHPTRRQTDLSFVAVMDVPIYSQGRTSSEVRQSHQLVAQRKVELVNVQRQVAELVRSTWGNIAAARQRITALIAKVKSGEVAVEGVSEEANVGVKTVLDVIQEQQSLVDAQVSLVGAEQELMIRSYQLIQAIGRLTAKDLKLNVKYYNPKEYYDEYSGAWIQFWKPEDRSYVKDYVKGGSVDDK